jgi:hypothetical protein
MARDDEDRLASLSLLASRTDFTEPGDVPLADAPGTYVLEK